jgi:RNA polymerase sigma-70 factor, ECF subfamily
MRNYDTSFIKQLKQHDHAAFNTFYLESVDMFFRYLHGNFDLPAQDMHDIIADFYVRFRENIHKFDEAQSFSGYIRTIFKNLLKDHFKKATDIPFTHLDNAENENSFGESLVDEEDITELFHQEFQLQEIQNAMKELDDISRDILHRKYIEEKENHEIEMLLGISNENFRQKHSRALKYLKTLLEKKGNAVSKKKK